MKRLQQSYLWVFTIILLIFVGVGFLTRKPPSPSVSPPIATNEPIDVDTFQQTFGAATDEYQAVPLEGWNSLWRTREEYDGTDMPNDALVEAINIDLGVKQSIAPRLGSVVLGTATTVANAITTLYTAGTDDGRELLLRTQSTLVEWWNSVAADWDIVATSSDTGRVYTFAQGKGSDEDNIFVYFADGKNSIRRFPVAFGTIASNTSTSVLLNSITNYTTAADQGFDPAGNYVTIDGNDYRYTDLNGLRLQGMSGLPTFGVNEGVIAADSGDGFTGAPTSSVALLVKNQRLHAAWRSNVWASRIDNLRNFSFSSPRTGGEGEIINYPDGGDITALADRGTYIAVFKKDAVYSLQFKDYGNSLFDIATPDTVVTGANTGAVNQKGVTERDYSVIYTTNDIGPVELTRLENKNYDESLYLWERIRPTAEDFYFTDPAVGFWQRKLVTSYRESSSTDFNNRVGLFDFSSNRLSEIRGWNASSWAIFDNKLYFGDALTKNVRQAFVDSYDDDGNPYITRAKTKWYNFGTPSNWKELGWVFVEGWITPNTTITFRINLDEGGALSQKNITIRGTGSYVADDPPSGTFGVNPFGLKSFSVVASNDSTLKHFAGWINTRDIFSKKFRNLQFVMETSAVSSNYRITRIIPYFNVLDINYSRTNNSDFTISQ